MYGSLLSYALTLTVVGPVLAPMQQALHLDDQQAGLLFSLFAAFFTSSVLGAGYLADRIGTRFVCLTGQGMVTLSALCYVAALHPLVLAAAFVFLGVGGGFLEASTNTVIGTLYRRTAVKDLNLLHVYFSVGALAGPFLSGRLYEMFPQWRGSYAACLVVCALQLARLKSLAFPATAVDPPPLRRMAAMAGKPWLLMLGLGMALYVGSEMSLNNWGVKFMETVQHQPKMEASTYLTLYWGAMAVGRLLVTRLAALGGEPLLMFFALGGFLSTLGFYLSPAGGPFLIAAGFCFSGIMPTILAVGAGRFPDYPGVVNGILMTWVGTGLITAPYLVGFLAEDRGLWAGMAVPVTSMGLLFLLGTLVCFLGRRRR